MPIIRDCRMSPELAQTSDKKGKMPHAEENHFPTQTEPDRVSPLIFLQITGEIASIDEEINMSAMPDRDGISAFHLAGAPNAEFRNFGKIAYRSFGEAQDNVGI